LPTENPYPLYSDTVLDDIITHIPVVRARDLLYKNGLVDPLLVTMEIEMFQRNEKVPGMYIGYLKSGHAEIENFSDLEQGEERLSQLRQMYDQSAESFVVVGGKKD
jgi:hypothetical protein